jgi:hypothetical protein
LSVVQPQFCTITVQTVIRLGHGLTKAEAGHQAKEVRVVLYPGKGGCGDPVNEDAILEKEKGGRPHSQDRERQLASDTGGDKT